MDRPRRQSHNIATGGGAGMDCPATLSVARHLPIPSYDEIEGLISTLREAADGRRVIHAHHFEAAMRLSTRVDMPQVYTAFAELLPFVQHSRLLAVLTSALMPLAGNEKVLYALMERFGKPDLSNADFAILPSVWYGLAPFLSNARVRAWFRRTLDAYRKRYFLAAPQWFQAAGLAASNPHVRQMILAEAEASARSDSRMDWRIVLDALGEHVYQSKIQDWLWERIGGGGLNDEAVGQILEGLIIRASKQPGGLSGDTALSRHLVHWLAAQGNAATGSINVHVQNAVTHTLQALGYGKLSDWVAKGCRVLLERLPDYVSNIAPDEVNVWLKNVVEEAMNHPECPSALQKYVNHYVYLRGRVATQHIRHVAAHHELNIAFDMSGAIADSIEGFLNSAFFFGQHSFYGVGAAIAFLKELPDNPETRQAKENVALGLFQRAFHLMRKATDVQTLANVAELVSQDVSSDAFREGMLAIANEWLHQDLSQLPEQDKQRVQQFFFTWVEAMRADAKHPAVRDVLSRVASDDTLISASVVKALAESGTDAQAAARQLDALLAISTKPKQQWLEDASARSALVSMWLKATEYQSKWLQKAIVIAQDRDAPMTLRKVAMLVLAHLSTQEPARAALITLLRQDTIPLDIFPVVAEKLVSEANESVMQVIEGYVATKIYEAASPAAQHITLHYIHHVLKALRPDAEDDPMIARLFTRAAQIALAGQEALSDVLADAIVVGSELDASWDAYSALLTPNANIRRAAMKALSKRQDLLQERALQTALRNILLTAEPDLSAHAARLLASVPMTRGSGLSPHSQEWHRAKGDRTYG